MTSNSSPNTYWAFTYDANGLRASRTNGSTVYKYTYDAGLLTQMSYGDIWLGFTYDANGKPIAVNYSGSNYYYALNLQGDVVAILNNSGVAVVRYTYDAWGRHLSISGSMASTLGQYTPFRYRGYIYDSETQLYYLQSRYYDPEIGRFINADDPGYLGADGTVISYNLFAYCSNNPVMGYDPSGCFSWIDVFNTAAVVTVAALAVIAIVSSGGAAAAPLLTAASALAGTTVTAAAATTVAAGVAITGVATMGAAATVSLLEASGNQGKDYIQARNNKQANQWAQEVGYDGAEELKADYVGKQGSKFNMFTDRATGEIILIGIKMATEIATHLFRKYGG